MPDTDREIDKEVADLKSREAFAASLAAAQSMMIEDGLPPSLLRSLEDRREAWNAVADRRRADNTPPQPNGADMKKKPHPADIAAEAQMTDAIRGADHFLASLFKGAGEYEKTNTSTVLNALESAKIMEAQHKGTQRCIFYAVGPDGHATMLTRELINRLLCAVPTQQESTMKPADNAKPTAAKKAAKAKPASGERARYDWTGAEEKAEAGKIPPKPDFSAATHKPFLPLFEQITAALKASDPAKALRAIEIKTTSSTPKAMDRYRNLCLKAVSRKTGKAAA
jgi:hypothetical protein